MRTARPRAYDVAVKTLLVLVGTTIGGWLGWWLGSQIGFLTACYASLLGTGVGLYAARRLAARYDDYIG
jgi:hypothetical protein